MPPRTRTGASKVFKENAEIIKKTKVKSDGKITKPPRKALADKTNSLSDDNESIVGSIKRKKIVLQNKAVNSNENISRPRRDRKLPSRYVESKVLNNLSNSKSNPVQSNATSIIATDTPSSNVASKKEVKKQPSKNEHLKVPITRQKRNCRVQSVKNTADKDTETPQQSVPSPFKTPTQNLDTSFIANRPKRIHRLPSRFEEHSISPSKFIPVQPCCASTPIVQKSAEPVNGVKCYDRLKTQGKQNNLTGKDKKDNLKKQDNGRNEIKYTKSIDHYFTKSQASKAVIASNSSKEKNSHDTNNNRKRGQVTKIKTKQVKANVGTGIGKRLLEKSLSFRVFEDKKDSNKNEDVYEFTFDPNEEPQPQKKKRKKPVQKRPPKPKIIKNNYDLNISKTIEALKSKVKKAEGPTNTQDQPSKTQPITQHTNTQLWTQPRNDQTKTQPKITRTTQALTQNTQLKTQPQTTRTTQALTQNTQLKTQTQSAQHKPQLSSQTQALTQNTQLKTQAQTIQLKTQPPIYTQAFTKNIQPLFTPFKTQPHIVQPETQPKNPPTVTSNDPGKIQIIENILIKPAPENKTLNNPALDDSLKKSLHMSNYASIRVEDIAADFDPDPGENDVNYSPVSSPRHPKTPDIHENLDISAINKKDPLNLQGDSFFDEQPIASSSMNESVRRYASPWRVEFNNLPIKWQADTYVKTNMTPAVESSFINREETHKRHVYTNLIDDTSNIQDPPQLKQPSIISFMRECAEKSLKKRRRSVSPRKVNSLFEDTYNDELGYNTPKKSRKDKVPATPNTSNSSHDKSHDKENSKDKETSKENKSKRNDKTPQKTSQKKDKDGTLFGFEDSETVDQENISPVKVQNTRARGLRTKSRAVLKEINTLSGPTRVDLPPSKKDKLRLEAANQLYDQVKSSEDAPTIPEKEKLGEETAPTNFDEPPNEDDESVHLFEDIELNHHLKPLRKSYGKAKKVAFRQRSTSDSDSQNPEREEKSTDEDDDLADLTFQMPEMTQKKVKKKKPKKQLSKKEEKEADEWAAGFNSMCEDVDGFLLEIE